jgi:4-amino-4-deoxy-L-arabinose transferase-like glycosyltransferase
MSGPAGQAVEDIGATPGLRASVARPPDGQQESAVAVLAWVFFLGLAIRLLYLAAVPPGVFGGDAQSYDELAWRLAQGAGYVNAQGQPTAWRPPGYPLFLAAIYRLAGHDLDAVRYVQALLGAGIGPLVFVILRRWATPKEALAAGLLCSVYPPLVVGTSEIMTELLFTVLLLLALSLLLLRREPAALAAGGALLGGALLTRPVLLFFLPFLAVWIARRDRPAAWRALAWLAAGLLLILLPWTLRNHERLNAFVPLSTIGGLALYNSYAVAERGLGYNSLADVPADYGGMDEVEQSRFLIRKTGDYVAAHPERSLLLTGLKLLLFVYPFDGRWYPLSFGSKYNVFWGLVFSLSLPALLRLRPGQADEPALLAFLFISFLLGAMVFYGSPRFRLPVEPLWVALAVQGVTRLRRRPALLWSIVAANLALFLFFRAYEPRALFDWLRSWI